MKIKMIYFAVLRDLVGLGEEDVQLNADDIKLESLLANLCSRHERLSMEGVRVAVNEEFASGGTVIKDGDVVALIPPVSGG